MATTACNNNTLYSEHKSVDEKGWNMDDELRFDIDVEDTTAIYDFYVDVRNSKEYPYSNLFLFVTTTFPDHLVRRDTLECPLADQFGQWYGKVSSNYVDGRYLLHNNIVFPMSGNYSFQVTHAMRDTNVTGIKNIGLHVKRLVK